MEDEAAAVENEEAGVAKVEKSAAVALGRSGDVMLRADASLQAPCVYRKLLYDALCSMHQSKEEGERGTCTEEEEQQHPSERLLLDARCSQLIRSALDQLELQQHRHVGGFATMQHSAVSRDQQRPSA